MAFKATALSALACAFVAMLATAFVMTGCTKNKNDDMREEPEIILLGYDPASLFVQVSKDPVVYIWQQLPLPPSKSNIQMDENNNTEYNDYMFAVKPSVLADALPRMESYKIERKAIGKTSSIMLSGDGRASCGSVIQIIDYAKRVGINEIVFDTAWHKTAVGFNYDAQQGPVRNTMIYPRYFDFKSDAKYASRIVTITISADNTIAWERQQVSLEEFIEKLKKYSINGGRANAVFMVEVDAKADFQTLRYVIDQINRCSIQKVMVCPRKTE